MRILHLEGPNAAQDVKCLRQEAADVTHQQISSAEIASLVTKMQETMRTAPGVGLAAPQVGVALKIIVIEDSQERQQQLSPVVLAERQRTPVSFHVMFNPRLLSLSLDPVYFFEGCLSVAGGCRITPRARAVQVEYQDSQGITRQLMATGWYARILQHEIDHLHGRLYTDFAPAATAVTQQDMAQWTNASHADILRYFTQCTGSFSKTLENPKS